MDGADLDKITKLGDIFMPYAKSQRDELKSNNTHMAYYCSAETANKLIRNQEFWFRDVKEMNDSMEVRGGIQLIDKYFSNVRHKRNFCKALDKCHDGVALAGLKMFDDWKNAHSANTFLMSFSKHAAKGSRLGKKEDQYGRLSMWRGYGGPEGVALIFNIPFDQRSDSLMLFFSPVGYFDDIEKQMAAILRKAKAEKEFLSGVNAEWVRNTIFIMLVMAATSLKHPGFCEEDEWRILYLPSTYRSKWVEEVKVKIGDHEETIHKIRFHNFSRAGINGLDLDTSLHRIIVGPSEYPEDIKRYIVDALRTAGVRNPEARVHISNIPFRFKI